MTRRPTIQSLHTRVCGLEHEVGEVKAEQKQLSRDVADVRTEQSAAHAKLDTLIGMLAEHAETKRVKLTTRAKAISSVIGASIGAVITGLMSGCL